MYSLTNRGRRGRQEIVHFETVDRGNRWNCVDLPDLFARFFFLFFISARFAIARKLARSRNYGRRRKNDKELKRGDGLVVHGDCAKERTN